MWWLLALALAKPLPDSLDQQWQSLQLLRADPTRYRLVTQPFTVQDGPLTLTIDSGLLVPVFSGHTPNDRRATGQVRVENWAEDGLEISKSEVGTLEFVGFVWVAGTGSVEVRWNERADDQIFENHLVRNLGAPREALAPVAAGAPWTTGATEGLVLSVAPDTRSLFLGPDDVAGDPLELVVYGEKARPGALERAHAVLARRSALFERAGVDPGDWIARDRISTARHPETAPAHAVIDVHVDQNLGDLNQPRSLQPTAADWLTLLRDETGVMDTRRGTTIDVIDVSKADQVISWRITGVPFPPSDPDDPLSPPVAPVRMVADEAYVIAAADDGASTAVMQVTARLRLRAVGGAIDSFDLQLPRGGTRKQFEVLSATTPDGVNLMSETPLVVHDPVLGPARPDEDDDAIADESDSKDGADRSRNKKPARTIQVDPYHDRPESRITLMPAEPLAAGDSLIVDIRWRDQWSLLGSSAVTVNYDGGSSTFITGGSGTGRKSLIPRLAGAPEGNPSKFRVRMMSPPRGKNFRTAASGAQLSVAVDDQWSTTESGNLDSPVPFADVGIGPFMAFDQGADGFPNVRTRMFSPIHGAEIAAEIRRMIVYYRGFLPDYPWPEHEIFQAPGSLNSWVWVAPHELTASMVAGATGIEAGSELARENGANTGQRVLAHELAHQWWGNYLRPAHSDDFWFAETFAESMAQMYMGAVRGDYERTLERKRKSWERSEGTVGIPRASLTDAYHSSSQPSIVYQYGPYVFQQMLRPRIGHDRYHGALDLLMRDHGGGPLTTERLQDYFEKSADRDLDDFFDFWVYGGFVPEQIVLLWSYAAGEVVGTVTSDVPFGTFDYPVQVDDQRVLVDVIDGEGHFALPVETRPQTVIADPDFRVLAGKRITREVDPAE